MTPCGSQPIPEASFRLDWKGESVHAHDRMDGQYVGADSRTMTYPQHKQPVIQSTMPAKNPAMARITKRNFRETLQASRTQTKYLI